MLKIRYALFVIVTMALSMSVSASDVSEKSYTEPSFTMYAGYSGFTEVVEQSVIVADMQASFTGVTINDLDKLKPYKSKFELIYAVIKPTNLAKMQNQNFDRMLITYRF